MRFIKECVIEEWRKSTTVGRLVWVPLFCVILPLSMIIFFIAAPIIFAFYIASRPIERCLLWLRGIIFK